MFPYTQSVGSLIGVIKAIGSHGVPDKFTTKELPIWGYKSSNDRPVISVLKHIGFLDNSGTPQQLWKDARTNPQAAAARGTKVGYSELFKMFPDAHRKDAEALTNFFKAKTTVGDSAVKQMVATFRSLAQYGDFDAVEAGASAEVATPTPGVQGNPTAIHASAQQFTGAGGMTINLNVELVVPTDATGDVYDKFFAAMKKHLLDGSK